MQDLYILLMGTEARWKKVWEQFVQSPAHVLIHDHSVLIFHASDLLLAALDEDAARRPPLDVLLDYIRAMWNADVLKVSVHGQHEEPIVYDSLPVDANSGIETSDGRTLVYISAVQRLVAGRLELTEIASRLESRRLEGGFACDR